MQWKEFRSHISYLSEEDLERVSRAFELGKKLHEGQTRKSGEPYFTHPIAVAGILADMHADGDTIIAALLHDTVEDTPFTLDDVRKEFNHSVPDLIDGVTKLTSEDLRGKTNLDEQIETLRKMFDLMRRDVRVIVIKLADRLHNMQTIEFLSEERRKTMAKETLDVYVKIADRLSMMDFRDELESLCLSVLEPEELSQLRHLRNTNEKLGARVMEDMRTTLSKEYAEESKHVTLLYEKKSWDKLRQQLAAEGSAVTGLSAITITFVCPSVDACYRVMGSLHQGWKRETLSFQDYINSPMLNGYKGLHTTIILSDGTRVRCKIRTHEMQSYAHDGITTLCFGERLKKLGEILPWTKQISAMTTDTQNKSEEFWENLQGDILGSFMIIHGPGDQTVAVPKGATVLDGAFYLFQDKANRIESILLNGHRVDLNRELHHAESLEVELSKEKTVTREWLDWTKTGLATAIIRKALGEEPRHNKLKKGKELLQEEMTKRKAGYIEEYNPEKLKNTLKLIGQNSLEEAYEAIADGHIKPSEVTNILFSKKTNGKKGEAKLCVIQFRIDLEDIDVIARTIEIYKKYGIEMKHIQLRPFSLLNGLVRVRVSLTREEQDAIALDLKNAGTSDISIRSAGSAVKRFVFIFVLLMLWGLDPVIAQSLLQGSFSYLDLTFIRVSTFFVASGLIYAGQLLFSKQKLKPLSPLHPALILSALALFCTALFSYIALHQNTATEYIFYILSGIVLATCIEKTLQRKERMSACVSLLLIGCAAFFTTIQEHAHVSTILASIGSAFAFTLYSRISKRYQIENAGIQARYPAFLFWLSAIGLILSFGLIPFTHLNTIPTDEMLKGILFILIFSVLPYGLYFESMRQIPANLLDRSIPFVVFFTMIGEMILFRNLSHIIVLPVVILFLWNEYEINKKRSLSNGG